MKYCSSAEPKLVARNSTWRQQCTGAPHQCHAVGYLYTKFYPDQQYCRSLDRRKVTCVDISEMSYSLCDMDCDQGINKSDKEEHCSDCLCVGSLVDLDQQEMPATKAWRPTSVVEERDRPKTLSFNLI